MCGISVVISKKNNSINMVINSLKQLQNRGYDSAGIATIKQKKFEIVEKYLSKLPSDMANWTKPTGGYFVSFNSKPGKAKKIYKLCENAGLKLTPVGATFPYGKDPKNQNLRISPTKISNLELKKAMEVFITSVMLAG